jgi:hypothetical protein
MKMELAGLGASYDLSRSKAEVRSKASEERQAKRLGEMQDALKRLQEMPSPKEIAKQNSMSRVNMLKERLEALKKMLLHASPELARILARELKTIAKELSSIAKSMEGGSQSAVSIPVTPEVATSATNESGNASAEAQSAATALAAVDKAVSGAKDADQANEDQAKPGESTAISLAKNSADSRQAGQNNGDSDLRDALQEAKKLLKEVIGMLKAKMALAANEAKMSKEEKQAKHDLQSAEKSLAEMDQALSQSGSELYSALGELGVASMGEGFSAAVSVSGLNINISA